MGTKKPNGRVSYIDLSTLSYDEYVSARGKYVEGHRMASRKGIENIVSPLLCDVDRVLTGEEAAAVVLSHSRLCYSRSQAAQFSSPSLLHESWGDTQLRIAGVLDQIYRHWHPED